MPLPPTLATFVADCRWEAVLAGEAGADVVRLTRVDGTTRYLKHGSGRTADDITDEMARLVWLAGRVPSARPVHFTRTDGAAWLLTDAVPGRTGDEWLEADPRQLPMVVRAFASFLRDLHALPVDDCPFRSDATVRLADARRRIDAGLVDEDDFDDDHRGWSAEEVWARMMPLRPTDADLVVTHGDFSLGNLLLDGSGRVTGCIDVGRLGIADRYQDIAILWQNLAEYGADAQALFCDTYALSRIDEPRLLFHRCLDELF